MNRGPLVSEATALPTEPQPLPFLIQLFNPFKIGGKRSFKEAPMDSYATPKFVYDMTSGTDLIKILQRKFYATQFLSILIGYSNLSTNQGA